MQCGLSIDKNECKKIDGYVGKPKGALQIACERGFVGLDGKLVNGKQATLDGGYTIDPVTKKRKIKDIETSLQAILGNCHDFKTEKTRLAKTLENLGVLLRVTPKCHPEIAGIGIEYAWGYAKMVFRKY